MAVPRAQGMVLQGRVLDDIYMNVRVPRIMAERKNRSCETESWRNIREHSQPLKIHPQDGDKGEMMVVQQNQRAVTVN